MKNVWEFEWANLSDFENERKSNKKAHDLFVLKWKKRKDYLEQPKVLKEALDNYEKLKQKYFFGGREGYYYWLNRELDENDLDIRARYNSIEEFIKEQENKLNFFQNNLGKLSGGKQKEFLENPVLIEYKNFLRNLFFEAKYLLEEKEEEIMNLKSTSAYSMWIRMVSSLLIKETRIIKIDGENKEKTYPELLSLMKEQDEEVRSAANFAFEDILSKYSDVAEAEINAILEDHKINDKIRGFERPDSLRLTEDNIDESFVDDLLKTVSSRFDISKKFYELKSKLLGKEKISYYERNIIYGKINKKYSWEDSEKLIKTVFGKLNPNFLKIFEKFLDEGRIDIFPKQNKRAGAFCVYGSIDLPTYVLLNHFGTLDDVITLAHELGHGINDELIKEKQNSIYFGTPLATAEVASTFMEDFVLEELLKTATDEEKLGILMQKLDRDISSIQRQVSCYLFEKEIHEAYRKDGYLSKQRIGKIFKDKMKQYLGEFVDTSKADNWWIYWPHIRDYFYVYSYASGLLISKAMQEKYSKDKNFMKKIEYFLSSGTSENPREIFEKMGFKLESSFWNQGLDKLDNLLGEAWDLARRLGKI